MVEATVSALVWPASVKRSATPVAGSGHLSVKRGVAGVVQALDLLGDVTSSAAAEVVVSYNHVRWGLRQADPGAAVWFLWNEVQRCIASDLYASPGANLSAIAQIILSCAAEHGRGSFAAVAHALDGYIPRMAPLAGAETSEHWSRALGTQHDASPQEITKAFRRRALQVHPDQGGTREQWDEVVSALERARRDTALPQLSLAEWGLDDRTTEEETWASLFPDPPDESSTV